MSFYRENGRQVLRKKGATLPACSCCPRPPRLLHRQQQAESLTGMPGGDQLSVQLSQTTAPPQAATSSLSLSATEKCAFTLPRFQWHFHVYLNVGLK